MISNSHNVPQFSQDLNGKKAIVSLLVFHCFFGVIEKNKFLNPIRNCYFFLLLGKKLEKLKL